jgi:RimJ/RimL family protein N-acetyltransferase
MTNTLTLIVDQEMTLRQFTVKDAPVIYALIDRNRIHLSQFGDITSEKYPTRQHVIDSIEHPEDPSKLRLGIWVKDAANGLANETYVGTINLTPIDDVTAEVGYYLGAEFQSKGKKEGHQRRYMTRALQCLMSYAYHEGYENLVAGVHVGNLASRIVLFSSGFQVDELFAQDLFEEEEKEDHIAYAKRLR